MTRKQRFLLRTQILYHALKDKHDVEGVKIKVPCHHDCVIECVLSYLGMNLLVFLQDIPVTERGWAR